VYEVGGGEKAKTVVGLGEAVDERCCCRFFL